MSNKELSLEEVITEVIERWQKLTGKTFKTKTGLGITEEQLKLIADACELSIRLRSGHRQLNDIEKAYLMKVIKAIIAEKVEEVKKDKLTNDYSNRKLGTL